ncbi:hypothetical protein B4U79_00660 [Dinothrombium tinctorium]|uniref:Uncharacterized protein n=1 Tax=Dinothrombium tinctorium TaxID=1965070 RepID=A0A3S3NPD4_9ACAR|nr:hypothetical protein B4U79_06254 [Dinothrombium tinctorium]RWR99139.1 hypothetical protein B4U79_02662 [Dinothrombium tinctorium]RWR99469.1 hypothetical protein B4U79_00660 [Dinothrombium tinctorium]
MVQIDVGSCALIWRPLRTVFAFQFNSTIFAYY